MHRRLIAAAGSAFVFALLLACGSGSPSPTAVPSGSTAATAAPAAPAPATSAPAAADATAVPEATAAPEAPSVAAVGDRIELEGVALTVTKAERTAQIGKLQKAQDGREFIVIEVLIENISADKADYNPFYFKVKDGEGFESNATINLDPAALKSGNLDKGSKARGGVAFDVAKGSKGLVLSYQSIPMTLSQKSISVALGDM